MKLKIGDEVLVVSGREKGKKGKIERILPVIDKVVVTGLNLYKRNKKSTSNNQKAGIIDIIKPLPVANVTFVCPKCKLPTRVGYTIKNNEKSRVCKKCDQIV
jgi:large subunit ribosomal protein L24